MADSKHMLHKVPHAKSYSSLYDIFGAMSYGNGFHMSSQKNKDQTAYHASYGESAKQLPEIDYKVSKSTEYVTVEKYQTLNREYSCKTIVPSTSTIFYDLDDIAKRHSFHCLTEVSVSNANFMKVLNLPAPPFGGKSTTIIQECATQLHPKLLSRDSRELNAKKVKKKISKDATLSSEIFLRDDDYLRGRQKHNHHHKDHSDRYQKFWSYAKYRTEYTKPIPEEKKSKKKDRGKRTEDPCPCQLFSYACPCTDKKSLTELAKNSKSLTVADQITSTTKVSTEENKDSNSNKTKKHKHDLVKQDKPTNTSVVELMEMVVPQIEQTAHVVNKEDVPLLCDKNNTNNNTKHKCKRRKKSRRILCPNCKEKVDVVISFSTTEEEESLKYEHSSIYRSKEIPSTTAYAYRASPNAPRSKNIDDGDLCLHEPRCELLPVCQILPTENFYNVNNKCVKKHSGPKTPRIIRITKACRHHPPCTVVPSCQRANVLKNNCEYIPPCLHRPRCVNLPLCVPFSKNLHYEETTNKIVDDMDTSDCPHIPRCKYIPACHHDSLTHMSNPLDQQINMVSRVQNGCDYLTDFNSPTFLVAPKTTCTAQTCPKHTFSPCQLSPNPLCYAEQYICRTNKSCQFDTSHCVCSNEYKEDPSNEAVIFIRDVGCQFRNKCYSPKDSVLHSKVSSNSFDFVDVKMGNYYTNIHTLRYEDKYTSPLSVEENSFSTVSYTSMDLDSECPSHGRRAYRNTRKLRPTTGFVPKAAYVTAYSSLAKPMKCDVKKSETQKFHDSPNTLAVKSRRSFLRGMKYRKMFSGKRKRKSRMSSHVLTCGSDN